MAKEAKFNGAEKAAILLLNIGEELAGEVCKHLNPNEMRLLGRVMVRKDTVSSSDGRQVMGEFVGLIDSGELAVEGLEYARNLLNKSLGQEKAQHIMDQLTREMGGGGGIETLKWMDPAIVANIIKNEHPQIIALILTHFEPDRAAQALMHIPEERVRADVMLRIANLKRIPQAAVIDLENLLSEQMLSADSSQGSSIEGVKIAAEIMNQIEGKNDCGIMDFIEKASPDLAIRIQEKMFVFPDLMGLDDKGMQQIIKELNNETLTLALKGTEEGLKEKFLKNMSERASEMLREDMETRGPVKLSDVEKAQQEIIKVARRLEQEGKIVRAGKGGDVFI